MLPLGIAFARELFLNITGYPRALLTTLALIYAAKLTYHLSVIPVKFAIRLIAYIFHLPDQVNLGNTGPNAVSK